MPVVLGPPSLNPSLIAQNTHTAGVVFSGRAKARPTLTPVSGPTVDFECLSDLGVMVTMMVVSGCQAKILGTIVGGIMIDVMDDILGLQPSTDGLGHDKAVFKFVSPRPIRQGGPDKNVPVFVNHPPAAPKGICLSPTLPQMRRVVPRRLADAAIPVTPPTAKPRSPHRRRLLSAKRVSALFADLGVNWHAPRYLEPVFCER